MTPEQQMKRALDGKFFYFAHDGAVKCKEVSEGFAGASSFKNNYRNYMAKSGQKAGAKKRNHLTWNEGQVAWLKENMDRKTVRQCSEALNIAYHRVYDRILRLRKAGAE